MTPDVGRVQSVDRALDLLELLLGSSGRPMGLGGLAGNAGLAPATAHRLLKSLEARGWVHRDAESRLYGVGPHALALLGAALPPYEALLTPHLTALARDIGDTANVAALRGRKAVYVAQAEGSHSVRMFTEVGNQVSMHRTGVGKVLLAFGPRSVAEAILAGDLLPAATPNSITSVGDLRAELARVEEEGFAVDREEEELGVTCVAVPIPTGHEIVLALSVSGPSGRIAPSIGSLVGRLRGAASQIADDLIDRRMV